MTSQDQIRAAIAAVAGERAAPARLADGRVTVILDTTGLAPARSADLEAEVRKAVEALPDVGEVRIALTAEKVGRRLIAVGSGKGGVGKSTFAANLAIALARAGHGVGLVDADIYGPSQPRLMGVEGSRAQAEDKRLIPVDTPSGVPMLSMGQLVKPGQAIAWRGPMAAGALGQLLDADWGDRGLLVADLPPGTGDVQLSMIQKYRPAGAIIVSTPQDLALIDATRAIDLFNQAGVPIIGLVENMAGYLCPHCGKASDPFGHGGAEDAAARLGIPFLGRVPLDIAIRLASDAGAPPAAGHDGPGEAFHAIAARIDAWLKQSS
ncbi:MAG: chromosome partitioning protein ParA [Sphingomonas sanxanigenens]|uniref:Iron-sulfur cluster carrier protein n=1 Tax=Sphingomonas sanxanigenens TaxID=397260 RepID=A0A2W5AEB0_9SPHN|nr:MAG: chromosome partitioning protein ParA [Sphingomonas sanxanigenens]